MNNENNQAMQDNNTVQENVNVQMNNTTQTDVSEVQNKPKNSAKKSAIIALVFSLISLFIFGWLSFAGLSLSITALKQSKTNNEPGKGIAIAGIIFSSICITLYIATLVLRNIHS